MHPIAHHAGEQALAPLLLLAGVWLPLLAAISRARVAAVRTRLTRKRGSTAEADRWMPASPGPGACDAEAPAGVWPAADEPVTVLYSRRVKPGREADFRAWAHGIVAASRQFPGHQGASVLDAPGSREYHILFTFADCKSMWAWLDAEERRRWLARVGELIEADRGLQQLTGLETWFKLPGANGPTMKPPPRWKMWLVSIVAVYPLVLAFQAVVVPRMVRLPFPLRALMFPLVLLTLMTFVVMPVVTRVLRRWLGPRQAAQAAAGHEQRASATFSMRPGWKRLREHTTSPSAVACQRETQDRTAVSSPSLTRGTSMTLWDQLGGQTWSQRAGPRAAGTKPARHRHHPARSRLKARLPRHPEAGRKPG